ncbi:MAG: DUF4301 family protein, partial [Rikenellaceae bacterium]|nr:DUF4301 family protein [Rikenellaceae bacterium]
MSWSNRDLAQISERDMKPAEVEKQLKCFVDGFDFLPVVAAATVGHGIVAPSPEQCEYYAEVYRKGLADRKVVKFVPASGAATRMFKELFAFVGEGQQSEAVNTLLARIDDFAFAGELFKCVSRNADDKAIVSAIIGKGLEYGVKPKGMVLFHKYENEVRTALEEHLVEGAMYGASQGKVNIHFTVSPEHIAGFKHLLDSVVGKYEKRFGVKYNIDFSVQKQSTDTIAVNPDNTPFRNADGSLLFRPAGHGALIENLAAIDADIVFVKNIDNVTVDSRKATTVEYKQVLAGLLIDVQTKAFKYIEDIDRGCADEVAIKEFVEQGLSVELPEECNLAQLRTILNRPIRVCGMVRNEGEPGGGPFWVKAADGSVSLQIAESSQIAPEDKHLMSEATHFNPVDLVCG